MASAGRDVVSHDEDALIDEAPSGYSNLLVRFVKIWENFVDLQWEKELFDGRETKKYHLVVRSSESRVEKILQKHETSYRLHALQPGTKYKVALRAMQEDGEWGNWDRTEVTTLQSVEVSVGDVGSSFIHGTFTWGNNAEESPTHCYVKPATFQLKVVKKEHVLDQMVCEQQLPISVRQFRLDELSVGGTFLVQMRAVSEYGDVGLWTPECRFLTLRDVKVWISEIGEDYAAIAWERADGEDSLEDAIPEFVAYLELEPDQRERDINGAIKARKVADVRFDYSHSKYRFPGLKAGRAYRLYYRHRNNLGDWAQWKEFRFLTLSPVAQVEVIAVGSDFIHFTWQREEQTIRFSQGTNVQKDTDTSKDVTAWVVMARDCVTGEETSMDLPGEENSTKLVALHPAREYSISVRAITRHGDSGLPSTERFISTLPPFYARAEARGEDWVLVSWDRKEKIFPDTITRYHLQLTGVETRFRLSKYFEPNETSYKFPQLKPNTKYYVTVQACVGIRWGQWSEPNTVSTASSCCVRLSRRGEDFIQVKWASDYVTSNAIEALEARYQLKVTKCRTYDQSDPLEPTDPSAPPPLVVDEELVGQTRYRLSKLPYGKRYAFSVRAWDFHESGWGNWSSEVILSTLDSAVTYTEVSETFFEVTWQARPRILSKVPPDYQGDEDDLAPDDVTKYILSIKRIEAGDTTSEVGQFHFNKGDRTHHAVSDLSPNTTYTTQIMTCDTSGAWSPWSAPAYVTTIGPIEVGCMDIGEDYARLTWRRHGLSNLTGSVSESETEYSIAVTELLPDDAGQAGLLNYNTVGNSEFTIKHLKPRTTYRIQVRSCPLRSKIWGKWSGPLYIRTVEPIQVDLDLVGEEYAHVSWNRAPASLPSGKFGEDVLVMVSAGSNKRYFTTHDAAAEEGNRLFNGDPSVMEYHIKVFEKPQATSTDNNDEEAEVESKLQYEVFTNSQTFLRIPSLRPDKQYEVRVAACNRWGEWGCWSNALTFKTAMPTEISIVEITREYVKAVWGKRRLKDRLPGDPAETTELSVEDDAKVVKYQLNVVGKDDDYSQEIITGGDVHHYCISGLNINCCYSIQVRSFVEEDEDWGRWSAPIFVAVRSVSVELSETSQDWMRVCWKNVQAKDLREKQLFVTRIGEGQSVTLTLPGDAIEHVFTGITPATHYSVHLLCIEQVPDYLPLGGGTPLALHQEETGRVDCSATAISIPVVATDYSSFFSDSSTFLTLHPIILQVNKYSENFMSLHWQRGSDQTGVIPHGVIPEEEAEYEVDVREFKPLNVTTSDITGQPDTAGDGSVGGKGIIGEEELLDPTPYRKVKGTSLIINGLMYNTKYRVAVRQMSSIPSLWSEPIILRTLDRLRVVVGGGSGETEGELEENIEGVGEDFVMLNWTSETNALPKPTSFDVRIMPVDSSGKPLATIQGDLDDMDNPPDGVMVIQCTNTRYRATQLHPDTLYRVNVRANMKEAGRTMHGYWSDDVFVATLAPMAAQVESVAEEHCLVKWRRKGKERHGGDSPNNKQTSLENVNRVHVRILRLEDVAKSLEDMENQLLQDPDLKALEDSDGVFVYQQQFGEEATEFADCTAMVTVLKPNTQYVVQVRASTNNYWGAWSKPLPFVTCLPFALKICLIGEETAFLEWGRDLHQNPSLKRVVSRKEDAVQDEEGLDELLKDEDIPMAQVEKFEVHIWTIGKDRQTLTNSVPPDRWRHRLKGLARNSHYSVTVRALYTTGHWGPLSNQIYFATLPPMVVHVGRIGETFVYVRWERQPQVRVTNRLRAQHRQQQAEFEANQSQIQARIKHLQQQLITTSEAANAMAERQRKKPSLVSPAPKGSEMSADPLSLSQLMNTPDEEEGDSLSASKAEDGKDDMAELSAENRRQLQELHQLQQLMAEQQRRQRELTRLQQVQLQELERETLYPHGDDVQYEVVILGTVNQEVLDITEATNSQGGASSPTTPLTKEDSTGKSRPFRFKKTLPKGKLSCKMDGLWPHSNYSVTVRAMYTNGYDVSALDPYYQTNDDVEEEGTQAVTEQAEKLDVTLSRLLWGEWADKVAFTTLKQVTLNVVGIGSDHVCIDWDTGYTPDDTTTQNTAISKFQIRVLDRLKGETGFKYERNLENPALRNYTVIGLESNRMYTVSIRVCYEDNKWGMWSNAVHFLTLNLMRAKIKTITESMAEFLVWRDKQMSDDKNVVIWKPRVTEHQLSINSIPSPSTFNLDLDTSTLLTLGDLATDTEFQIQVREKDRNKEWREWHDLVSLETLPFAPSKPILDERRGTHVSVSWNLKKNCPSASYVFCVEMAYMKKSKKSGPVEHEPFQVMGLLYEQSIRIELQKMELPKCLFRVKVAKEHQGLDGSRAVDATSAEPQMEDLANYLWSRYSPVAHFKTPSVPDHPTGLRITQLKDTSAVLRWKKPNNYKLHTNLSYKVHLNIKYGERFVCIGQTESMFFNLANLACNTHYRVAVTAESSMGISTGNNTLHFSTRPETDPESNENPMGSTLPPRMALKPPEAFDTEADALRLALAEAAEDAMFGSSPNGSMEHPFSMDAANHPLSARSKGSLQGRSPYNIKGRQAERPSSQTDFHRPEAAHLEVRSQSAGPYSKPQGGGTPTFLPAVTPGGRPSFVNQPQVNNFIPDSGYPYADGINNFTGAAEN